MFNSSDPVVVSAPLAGTPASSGALSGISLAQTGSGTTTLSGFNSFSGSVNITQGTLALGAANTLPGGVAINLSGGSLLMSNSNAVGTVTVSSGSITGTGTLSSANFNFNNTGGAQINVSAPLGTPNAGSTALVENGTGTTTLSGANSFSGSTTVTAGL